MNDLSAGAQDEIAAGRAVLLEGALKQILESVEEVVSYTLSEASVQFHCRLHDPIAIPLARFCLMQGIVSNETVNNTILLLRTHTGETITFKR